MNNSAMVSKTDKTGIIRLSDVPIDGDFVLIMKGIPDGIVFDSRIDGGDVSPLLFSAPVVGIEAKENILHITIIDELFLNGI